MKEFERIMNQRIQEHESVGSSYVNALREILEIGKDPSRRLSQVIIDAAQHQIRYHDNPDGWGRDFFNWNPMFRKPRHTMTMYRGVPEDGSLNIGDFVTSDRSQAELYAAGRRFNNEEWSGVEKYLKNEIHFTDLPEHLQPLLQKTPKQRIWKGMVVNGLGSGKVIEQEIALDDLVWYHTNEFIYAPNGSVKASFADHIQEKITGNIESAASEEAQQVASKIDPKLLVGIGSAAILGYVAFKNATKHKHGKVRRHPHGDRSAIQKENVRSAAFISGMASSALHLFKPNTSPALRSKLFFGLTLGAGIVTDRMRGLSPVTSVASNAGAVAAGYVAYSKIKQISGKGLASLKTHLLQTSPESKVLQTLTQIEKAKQNFPLLDRFLSRETLGIATAVAAIPIAHNFIQRIVSKFHLRKMEHVETVMGPSAQENQAGRRSGRKDNSPSVGPQPQATLNISGQLRSFYDVNSPSARRNIAESL